MNLLHVISSMDPSSGGPCQVIRNLVKELQKTDVYNEVVSVDDPYASFLKDDLFKINALGPCMSQWQYSNKLLPWLEKNIERFDVILVHGIWLYHSYAANKMLKLYKAFKGRKKIKIFIMPHGMLDPYFQNAPGRKLKALRNQIYWKFIEGKVINNADGLIFTCQEELRLARKSFHPYQPKSEINVGCGISAPQPCSLKMYDAFLQICTVLKNNSYLLFLSRIHEKKGVDILIKAYATIAKNASTKNLLPKLVIAGPGLETHYGQKVRKMVFQDPYLKNAVLFTNMLTGDAKWGAFYGCDAFILPSHQENFGIAIVEAMACGRPVLISDKVNIWREVKEGCGGLIAEDSQKGIENLLNEWLSMTIYEKQLMGKKANAAYEKYFTVNASIRSLKKAIVTEQEVEIK